MGGDSPREIAKTYFDEFNSFYKSVSYGNIQFTYEVPDRYFRIDKPSNSYRLNQIKGDTNPDGATYFQDALRVADPSVDFSPYDVVYIIPSNTVTEITYGPAFPMGSGNDLLKTNEKTFRSGSFAGTDSRRQENSLEWVWLAHETGHLFGLEHPWRTGVLTSSGNLDNSSIAIWDLMMSMGKSSPTSHEFLGWTRFLIGWLDDDRINCQVRQALLSGPIDLVLSPLVGNSLGTKLALVKISDTKAIAIEVRQNLGFDRIPTQFEGVLIYQVDVSKHSNEGMATLISSNKETINGNSIGTMRIGDEVSFENMRFEVLHSDPNNYFVRISKN